MTVTGKPVGTLPEAAAVTNADYILVFQDGALKRAAGTGFRGDPATINGENVLTIEAGENVTIAQGEGTLTISADGAITGATVNGTEATVTDKKIILSVPTQTSDLNNDSGYQTAAQVDASISARVATLYKPGGSATLSTLPPLTAASLGHVYDMTEAFTTNADFKEGAGNAYPAGTNVAIVDVGSGAYKYDALSGFVDLSGKQDKLAVTGEANKGVYVSAAGVVSAMTHSLNADVPANFAPATAAPLMDGAAATGTSAKYAREDHRHPTDTSRAAAVDVAKIFDYLSTMEVYRTASGNPATFSDGKAANLKALSVTIAPTQGGSGAPSPSNVRPISGVSSVTVTRTGESGANSQSVTVSLSDGSNPLTVYGGTLDATAGTLTVTHKALVMPSTGWTMENGTRFTLFNAFPDSTVQEASALTDKICSHYAPSSVNATWAGAANNIFAGSGAMTVVDRRFSTAAEFMAWLAGNETPVQVCYKLAAPVTYQLAPAQLAALAGYNSVSSDAGTLSVTYLSDPSIALGGA